MRVVRWLLAHQVTMVGWKRCHNDQGNASSSSLLTTGLRPTLPPSAVSAAAVYAKPCSTQEAFQVQPRLIGIGSCGANSEPWSVYSEKLSGIPRRDSSCAGGRGSTTQSRVRVSPSTTPAYREVGWNDDQGGGVEMYKILTFATVCQWLMRSMQAAGVVCPTQILNRYRMPSLATASCPVRSESDGSPCSA